MDNERQVRVFMSISEGRDYQGEPSDTWVGRLRRGSHFVDASLRLRATSEVDDGQLDLASWVNYYESFKTLNMSRAPASATG